MRGLSSILSTCIFRNELIKINKTGTRMLAYIYHRTLNYLKIAIFVGKMTIFCHILRNVIMDAIILRYKFCVPLVVDRFYYMV